MSECPKCNKKYNIGDAMCRYCGFAFPFTTDILPEGKILQDKYEIKKLIHSGGMGYVYLAFDKKLQCQRVVKQIKESIKSPEHRKLLEEEALHMAQLNNPNIATIFDHFVTDSYYYLVAEFVSGKTLSQIYDESKNHLEESKVVGWASTICDAVSYMHEKGFVYRDISPDNVMINEEGLIKLVDFGSLLDLNGHGEQSDREGKFGYTPPEQWEGNPVPQSDVFAIGAMVFYLLTGYTPISEQYQNGGKPLPSDYKPGYVPIRQKNPTSSENLEAILIKALDLDINHRFASARKLKEALESYKRTLLIHRDSKSKPLKSNLNFKISEMSIDFGVIVPGIEFIKSIKVIQMGKGALEVAFYSKENWLKASPRSFKNILGVERYEKNVTISLDVAKLPHDFQGSGYFDIKTNAGGSSLEVKVDTTWFDAEDNFKPVKLN